MGRVDVELETGADQQRIYQDIQQEVARIRTFPLDAERPVVSLEMRRREVLDLQVYGDVEEYVLRDIAEDVRDRLLQDPGISQVDYAGARSYEIHVEIGKETLRALGLTLADVAQRIRENAVEVPGGTVKTESGDVLLRMRERRDWAYEFARIPIVTSAEGAVRTLGDIATVKDTFEDVDVSATFNGQRSINLEVYRVGEETPIGVSDAARAALREIEQYLPTGVSYTINRDRSDIYRQRLDLLLRNGFLGLAPRPARPRAVPRLPAGVLGDPRHPHVVPRRDAVPALVRRDDQHDLDVRVHRGAGHRGRRRDRRGREHLQLSRAGRELRRGGDPGRARRRDAHRLQHLHQHRRVHAAAVHPRASSGKIWARHPDRGDDRVRRSRGSRR